MCRLQGRSSGPRARPDAARRGIRSRPHRAAAAAIRRECGRANSPGALALRRRVCQTEPFAMHDKVIEPSPDAEAAQPAAVEAPPEIGRGWLAAFRALRHRNFRLFFAGQLTSLTGTWMQTVAQSWLVLKLTNSPLMLGVVTFANYVPILIVALFAGVIVDHADRRRL